jgi:hypothetical protein
VRRSEQRKHRDDAPVLVLLALATEVHLRPTRRAEELDAHPALERRELLVAVVAHWLGQLVQQVLRPPPPDLARVLVVVERPTTLVVPHLLPPLLELLTQRLGASPGQL